MPSLPTSGGSYADPTWGTTTYRIAEASGVTAQPFVVGSEVQEWNSDGTKMFLADGTNGGNYLILYDATTTPPTPINRITTSDGTWISAVSCDALWAYTDPNTIYYIPCAFGSGNAGGAALQLRSINVSGCTSSSCVLTPTVIHTFSCQTDSYTSTPYVSGGPALGAYGQQVETGTGGGGGMFDNTDSQFSFACNINGHYEIDLIRYNKSTDSVTTQTKWYNICPSSLPTNCADFNNYHGKAMFRLHAHPDARYVVMDWDTSAGDDTEWVRGEGSEVYGPTWNFLGVGSVAANHQDNGFDVNGVPVLVIVGGNVRSYPPDSRAIGVTDLTAISTTGPTEKTFLLPCSFSYSGGCETGTQFQSKVNSSHISMNGAQKGGSQTFQGYALMSTFVLSGTGGVYAVDFPAATTLGTAVGSPGVVTVTPGSMTNIGVGVRSVIDYNQANAESVTWTSVTPTTATATFAKTHLSSAAVSCVSCGDTGFGALENFAVKIDTTAANESNLIYYRIGRNMSPRDGNYFAEPHTTISRDFTQMTWESNWDVDGGTTYEFWTPLSAGSTPPTGFGPNWTFFWGGSFQ